MKFTRVCIWIVALAALTAPLANASAGDYYTINFTLGGGGTLPSAGSFYYDPVTQTFSDFTVVWDGITFDLTASANAPAFGTGPFPPCGGLTGGAAGFALLDQTCTSVGPTGELESSWLAKTAFGSTEFAFETFDATNNHNAITVYATPPPPSGIGAASGGGTWTIVDPDPDGPGPDPDLPGVPEPSSLSLITSALLSGAAFARKRFAGMS